MIIDNKIQFYLRRLHGLTGIFPIGFFLFLHLKRNLTVTSEGFVFSLIFLWMPLFFHGLYGLIISYESSVNICCYRYLRNFMYFLQRWTGLFIFFFLSYHIYVMKKGVFSNNFLDEFLLFSFVIVSIFHFSNGIFGFLVDFGITVGEKAQKFAVIFSFFIFFLFGFYGAIKFLAFVG